MKNLLVLIVAAFVALLTAAGRAQDFAPPRLSSTPSAEPTPSPSPSIAPKKSTAAASPKRVRTPKTAAALKLSAPRRDVLKEKPIRAIEERPAPTRRLPAVPRQNRRISRPTFDLSESTWVVAATLRGLENRWEDAVKSHDAGALQDLLSPNFRATSVDGNEASLTRVLLLLRRDKNNYQSARAHGMQVKNLGDGSAIVTGVAVERGISSDGKAFHLSRSFSDTWKLRNGRWRCVASRLIKERQR